MFLSILITLPERSGNHCLQNVTIIGVIVRWVKELLHYEGTERHPFFGEIVLNCFNNQGLGQRQKEREKEAGKRTVCK